MVKPDRVRMNNFSGEQSSSLARIMMQELAVGQAFYALSLICSLFTVCGRCVHYVLLCGVIICLVIVYIRI